MMIPAGMYQEYHTGTTARISGQRFCSSRFTFDIRIKTNTLFNPIHPAGIIKINRTTMDNFQARAQAAASSILTKSPAEAFAQSLTNDRPTIDSAVKSYMALTSARGASSNLASNKAEIVDVVKNALGSVKTGKEQCFFKKSKNVTMAPLLCARSILKTINAFQITDDTLDEKKGEARDPELQVIKILWNGLVENGKKPSMILGRQSLSYVYPILSQTLMDNIPEGVDVEEGQAFMIEFGRLLENGMKRRNASIPTKEREVMNRYDDDACLLWDTDGGKEELKRRRDRRKDNVQAAKESLTDSVKESLTIEEIEEGNEEDEATE
jgi:hypothetical protein